MSGDWKSCVRCGRRTQWQSEGRCAPCDAIVCYTAIVEDHGGMQQTAESLIDRLQQSGWYLSREEEWSRAS